MMNLQNHLQNLLNRNHLLIMIMIRILDLVIQKEEILGLEVVGKVLLQGVVAWQPLEEEVKINIWILSKCDD